MEDFTLYQWLVLSLLSLIALLLLVMVGLLWWAPTIHSLEAMTRRLEEHMVKIRVQQSELADRHD